MERGSGINGAEELSKGPRIIVVEGVEKSMWI